MGAALVPVCEHARASQLTPYAKDVCTHNTGCIAAAAVCARWVDATAGEEAVHAEILERWNLPQHEGGCGNSGRLT